MANLQKWSPEVQLQLLQSYLKGNALVFYQGLPDKGKATFEAAVASLRAHFDDNTIRNSFHIALHNRKQGMNETVSQFACELEKQFIRLDIQGNHYKLFIFLDGLLHICSLTFERPDLFFISRPKSWSETLKQL